MRLRGKLQRLEKVMQGKLSHFELADGRQYYFDRQEAHKTMFLFLADSMTADYKREPRPEPPDLLRAVAGARDRGQALTLVLDGYPHLPLDGEALVERGEFVPRSLVAGRGQGRGYGDFDGLEDLSE